MDWISAATILGSAATVVSSLMVLLSRMETRLDSRFESIERHIDRIESRLDAYIIGNDDKVGLLTQRLDHLYNIIIDLLKSQRKEG